MTRPSACSADFFMEHSELRREHGGRVGVVLPRGCVAGPLLLEAQEQQPPGSRLWLDLDPAARVGAPKVRLALPEAGEGLALAAAWLQMLLLLLPSRGPAHPPRASAPCGPQERLGDVPVYAHPKAVVREDGAVEAIEVTYITLYAFNGPYAVGGVPFVTTGAHDGALAEGGAGMHAGVAPFTPVHTWLRLPLPPPAGDWEHITVRLHPVSGDLLGAFYNAHRPRDGTWVAAPQVRQLRLAGCWERAMQLGRPTWPDEL